MKKSILTGYPHIDKPWMKYYFSQGITQEQINDCLDIPNMNMTEYLKSETKDCKNKIAYIYYCKETTYDEMFHNADIASKVFSQIGVNKGENILYLVSNVPEEEELWFGATQIGAVSDYIDPRPDSMDMIANAKKVLEIIKYEKPKYIVALDKCYLGMLKPIEHELKDLGIGNIIILSASDSMDINAQYEYLKDIINYDRLKDGKSIVKEFGGIEKLIREKAVLEKLSSMNMLEETLNEAIKNSPLRIMKYKNLARECENSKIEIVHDPNSINYIGHTSGTSGTRPKPIALSNKNAISSLKQCKLAGVGPKEGETSLHILPGFAPFGRFNNGIQTYANKGTNIHIDEFVFNEFGYLILKYKPNAIMTPPSFLDQIFNSAYMKGEDLSFLHKIVYGGDSKSADDEININNKLQEHGCNYPVEKGHGMSEYCGCGTYAKADYNLFDSIGIPIPQTTYSIVDPDIEDKLVPLKFEENMDRLKGELVVSSEHVTNGIFNGDVIVKHYEMDGKSYIRTRDLAEMDRNGIFYISARKDRSFTRIDGYKIKPNEIEKEIEKNDKVRYAKIVDYYDEKLKGNMPLCHIVLKNPNITEDEKEEIVKEIVYEQIIGNPTMSSRQIPSKFKFRDSLPLTKNNKIDINALRTEPLDQVDVNVEVSETNLTVGDIKIFRML